MTEFLMTIGDFFVQVPLDQLLVFAILLVTIIAFFWGRFRYDVVAILALLATVLLGLLPAEQAFAGFTHPAVVIVISMFILSQALVNSGIVEYVTRHVSGLAGRPTLQLLLLTTFVAVMSGFLANVGALAFSIPIAIKMAKESDVSPSMFLMPVAFASHLGAFLTLIGSASNVIISGFREEAVGSGFAVFDFATIGIGVLVVGILFLSLAGWRLLPSRKTDEESSLFSDTNYLTEMKVPTDSAAVGKQLTDLPPSENNSVDFIAVIRDGNRIDNPFLTMELQPEDTILLQDNAEALSELKEANGLKLVGERARESRIDNDDEIVDVEAVVTEGSSLVGNAWKQVPLAVHYGVNLLAASRSGGQLNKHLDDLRFEVGDVLLLRGRDDSIQHTIEELGCLPLESRNLTFGRHRTMLTTFGLFAAAVAAASLGFLPVHITFLTAAVFAVLFNLVGMKEAYETVNWSVIVLLGAIISFGEALVVTGGTDQIANGIVSLAGFISPTTMLVVVLLVTTVLSDFVNANVSAVVMAPVAIMIGQTLGVSIDPLLLAVAVGANMAFLTPTAHESNTLVMGPGSYKYRDFWKLGLPMEIIIATVSVPLILYFWPLQPETINQPEGNLQSTVDQQMMCKKDISKIAEL
jgi:di/tricarboxylate transporter